MTQTGYTSAIVDAMLGWLKGLASWVLKLFNLSGGFSPLKFLANNWLQLLIFFLLLGLAIDLLVWLIRWRPHWVWFRKKRVIINDANFFAGEKDMDLDDDDDGDEWEFDPVKPGGKPRRDWEDSDFVVPSAARRRREEERRRSRAAGDGEAGQGAQRSGSKDVFTDGLFNVNVKQRYSDKYEDEVFSVKDLPGVNGEDAWQEASPAPESRSREYVVTARPSEPQRRAPGNKKASRADVRRKQSKDFVVRKQDGYAARKR